MWLQIGFLPPQTLSVNFQAYSWLEKFGIPDARRSDWLRLKYPAYDNFQNGRIIVDNTDKEKFSQTYGTPVQIAAARRNASYWSEDNNKNPIPQLALVFRGANENEQQREGRIIKKCWDRV